MNAFIAALVDDAREAHALYETMRTEELYRLKAAFELDQRAATTPESIAFGGGRLALIAHVLRRRLASGVPEASER